MKKHTSKQNLIATSLHIKLTLIVVFTLFTSSILIGGFSYYTAKAELDRSGETILKNGVNMVKEAIELKVKEVDLGLQDIDSAQEDIKQFILGPKDESGKRPINKNIDLGENGYIFILNDKADELAHPSIEGLNTWDTLDMSGKEFYVARDIIEKALSGGGFTYYSWTYPFDERIAPKVSYAEVDPNWDWIVVSTIYMEDYNRGANRIFNVLIVTSLLIFLIGIAFVVLISKLISKPITTIAHSMENFNLGATTFEPIIVSNNDEIGLLASSFNQMSITLNQEILKRIESEEKLQSLNGMLEERVNERTKALYNSNLMLTQTLDMSEVHKFELEETNKKLQTSLEELKNTQKKLVESERMASLASLVSGVAHELNTPLGTSITLGSYVNSNILKLKNSYESGSLSKNEFSNSIDNLIESTYLLNQSLDVANTMVESFKQISFDQQINIVSTFNLKDQVNLILINLEHEIDKEKIEIEFECKDEIMMNTSSEYFNYIFSNLIQNSLMHAFDDEVGGKISIKIENRDSDIIISYMDSGAGVQDHLLKEIFEPFYTTTRSNGQIGLGLFVVYNIVTQKFDGSILASNTNKGGLEFEITIPTE